MSRETENFSMYSVISMRIRFFSSSKRASARALASSVLPTPVGPRNRKDPMGRSGSWMPARERRIASETLVTASSWPITRLWSTSSMCSSLSRSPSISLVTGIPVHRATIRAISSSVTRSCSRVESRSAASASFSSSASSFWSWGRRPYLSSAAFCRSYCIWADSMSAFTFSISSRRERTLTMALFSFSTWPSCRRTAPAGRPAGAAAPPDARWRAGRSPSGGRPPRSPAA